MIPRTKVNYSLRDLVRASFLTEGSGAQRQALTQHLVALFDSENILLTASARGSLYILLSCLPQQKVLVPAYTCKAVIEAARLAGKEIVFGESEQDGFNMSPDGLVELLDSNTILLATHQFGIPCAIRPMLESARAVGAYVIEDAAASLGSRVGGQLTGSFGDAAIFSFDSTKLINAPLKGGFLLVRDPILLARCQAFMSSCTAPMPALRKLRYLLLGAALVLLKQPTLYRLFHNLKFHWRGRFTDDSAESHAQLGPFYVDRLAEWQADLLLPQIARLDQIIASRRQMYETYLRHLEGATSFLLPPPNLHNEWSPIRFTIRVRGDKMHLYRRATRYGIDFAFSFTFIASPAVYSRSHRLAASVLNLPFYDELTVEELERVVLVLRTLDQN